MTGGSCQSPEVVSRLMGGSRLLPLCAGTLAALLLVEAYGFPSLAAVAWVRRPPRRLCSFVEVSGRVRCARHFELCLEAERVACSLVFQPCFFTFRDYALSFSPHISLFPQPPTNRTRRASLTPYISFLL